MNRAAVWKTAMEKSRREKGNAGPTLRSKRDRIKAKYNEKRVYGKGFSGKLARLPDPAAVLRLQQAHLQPSAFHAPSAVFAFHRNA
jgi:hypothetical protein